MPQKIRTGRAGRSSVDMDTEITYDIESPVVATKTVVRIRNNTDTMKPIGSDCVIAKRAAGRLKPSKAIETEPGFVSSALIPVPPTMVNQKAVTMGATSASMITIDRIERPREMRAMKIAMSGPYPKNQPQKNTVHQPSQPGSPKTPASPRNRAMPKKSVKYVAKPPKKPLKIKAVGPATRMNSSKTAPRMMLNRLRIWIPFDRPVAADVV